MKHFFTKYKITNVPDLDISTKVVWGHDMIHALNNHQTMMRKAGYEIDFIEAIELKG